MTATWVGPLDQVSLYCRDVDRSKRFYTEVLGFPHLGTYGDLVFFDMSGVRLYLHRVDDDSWRAGSVLYFDVGDIAGGAKALSDAGVRLSEQPHLIHREESTGEETWMAFFEDPDGNLLALSSRATPA
jgi:catechol 2,3-dioxygenase-like lactoylglutathione lyase family enzyme